MKNKINLLKLQLKREQSGIKKNKSMTEGIIKKKIIVNKIQQYVSNYKNIEENKG
jgi:hypothetical protein